MQIGPFTPKDHLVITTLGLEFAVAVGLGAGAGYLADKHWHAAPWLTVTGVIAGFALGMYILIRQAKEMGRRDAQSKDDKKNGSI